MGFGFGVKKKKLFNSTPEINVQQTQQVTKTPDKIKVKALLDSIILHYKDYSVDFSIYNWIAENIDDPDIEPVVNLVSMPVLSYKESIERVKSTIANSELPRDFIPDTVNSVDTDNKIGNLEVTIL